MGEEFMSICQLETKRLLWLIGITFAVILLFQYLELPYGNVHFSLFSATKIPAPARNSFQNADPPSNPQIFDNATIFHQSNSTGEHSTETTNNTISSEENVKIPESGFVLESDKESNNSLGFDAANGSSKVDMTKKSDNASATEIVWEKEQSNYINTTDLNNFTSNSGEYNTSSSSEHISGSSYAASPSPTNTTANVNPGVTTPELSNNSNLSLFGKDSQDNVSTSMKDENASPPQTDVRRPTNNPRVPNPEVMSISDMIDLLLQSRSSFRSMRPHWSSARDRALLRVRSEIENAPVVQNDPSLFAPIYRNVSMFKRSYELMEKILKVYVYREGSRPILHSPFLGGIYASEGWFMRHMEANKQYVTKDPTKAQLFYLPFSSRMLEETLYVQNSHSHTNLVQFLNDYVGLIAGKYPFWNRTEGADHFLVACHDWAPAETRERLDKCIKALCNSDVKEGFILGKDVSLPETYIRNIKNPTKDFRGKPLSKRTILAFFAGSIHGYVRPILWQYWENKDPDMKIFEKLPRSKHDMNYIDYMKSSKYCICAKGYEVNSPRVVEAIFYECVPVIISDNFVPPFFEVLNWESFVVFVLEKDIPNLKNILLSIPERKYLQMLLRVKKVQQHFLWHTKAVKYDIFNMILHSVWYNRVFTI